MLIQPPGSISSSKNAYDLYASLRRELNELSRVIVFGSGFRDFGEG